MIGKEEKDILCFYAFCVYLYTCVMAVYQCVCGYMHVFTPKQTSHASFVLVRSPDWTFDWAQGYDVTTWKYFDGYEGTGASQGGQ